MQLRTSCLLVLTPIWAVNAISSSNILSKRQAPDISCSSSSSVQCLAPAGSVPTEDFSGLAFDFQNYLHGSTMSGIGSLGARKRSTIAAVNLEKRQAAGGFCCPTGTSWSCNILQAYSIPICYNSETTQFAFSDGSYGYDNTGEYYLPNGNRINLLTGDYELADGTEGNILVDNGQAAPDTSTVTGSATGAGTTVAPTSSSSASPDSDSGSNGARRTGGSLQETALLLAVGFLIVGMLL